MTTIGDIETLLTPAGLLCRGGFHPVLADDVPVAGQTVILIGNAGPEMWRAFIESRQDVADPLDAWTRQTLTSIAEKLEATALFPFDGPPYLPFQTWAQKAETVFPSPIGPLIHPDYGLWHAYRGAFVFADSLPLPSRHDTASPCVTCLDKPCLSHCPVDAMSEQGYDVPACVSHIQSAAGQDCRQDACLARRACPIGENYQYATEQAGFHMRAFIHGNQS